MLLTCKKELFKSQKSIFNVNLLWNMRKSAAPMMFSGLDW